MLNTVYYLEITHPEQDRRQGLQSPSPLVINQVMPPNGSINAQFYRQVGHHYHWHDRLLWDSQTWDNYVNQDNIKTYVAKKKSSSDGDCGYYELKKTTHSQNQSLEVEIVYFGLLPGFIGQGLGAALLSGAIESAFNDFHQRPDRVWLHTCSLDHPHALKNYLARGFTLYQQHLEELEIS